MKMKFFTALVAFLLGGMSVYSALEWPPEGSPRRKDVEWLMDYWDIKLSASQTVHKDDFFSVDNLSQTFDTHVEKGRSNLSSKGGKLQVFDVFNQDGERVLSVVTESKNSYEDMMREFLVGFTFRSMRVQDAAKLWKLEHSRIGDFCISTPSQILEPGATNRVFFAIRDNISMTLDPISDEINVEELLRKMDRLLLAKPVAKDLNQDVLELPIKQASIAAADGVGTLGNVNKGVPEVEECRVSTLDDQLLEGKRSLWPYVLFFIMICLGFGIWLKRRETK